MASTASKISLSQSPLWLDEIWTLGLISKLNFFYDIFTLNHDNNHILNSLFLFFMDKDSHYSSIRIIHVVFGIMTPVIPLVYIFRTNKITALTHCCPN